MAVIRESFSAQIDGDLGVDSIRAKPANAGGQGDSGLD